MNGMDKRHVVMADDDRDFQEIIRGWLTPAYDFSSFISGEGLLEQLEEIAPDLLILDICMPGPDGLSLCRRIRGNPKFSALPILFLTGCKDDERFIKNIEVGGSAYLNKPIERRQLLSVVRELIAEGAAA